MASEASGRREAGYSGASRNCPIHLTGKPGDHTSALQEASVTSVPEMQPDNASLGSRLEVQPPLGGVQEVAAARSSLKSRLIVQ